MKRSLGPEPKEVKLASDTISVEDISELKSWLDTNPQLTKGPETLAFEAEFAQYLGTERGLFVNSGSSANLLVATALLEMGRLTNKKIVCPAVSWVTTVTPFLHLGYEVFLCEADKVNLGLDIEHLRRIFEEEQPSALILVHVLGHENHMKEIVELCREFGVVLLEDACEALGSENKDFGKLGAIGLAGTSSFYFGHHISTIEGGMVATNDDELYQTMLSIRSHGWSRDLSLTKRDELMEAHEVDSFRDLYTFYYKGFNLRSTDLQAYLGRMQMPKLPQIVDSRQKNYWNYKENLAAFWTQSSKTSVLSSFGFGLAVENRIEVAEKLGMLGIQTRPLICGNLGRHPFWKNHTGRFDHFPMADFVHDYGMYLPNHANLGSDDVERVSKAILSVAKPIEPPA